MRFVIDIPRVFDAPPKVSVEQFYGIEIEDFPCQIAQVGMWLAEHLMNMTVSEHFGQYCVRLPLTQSAVIVHGNALRIDWESVVAKSKLSYILSNPPCVGYSYQKKEQKEDILSCYRNSGGKPHKTAGKIDYVAAWYYKASKYLTGTQTRAAFVSTNSITQGEQVAAVWKPLFEQFGIHIDFAYRTFKWTNDGGEGGKAAIHCVIVGFSTGNDREKVIYDGDKRVVAKSINPYLVDGQNIFIENRKEPICKVPKIVTGNRPADGGNLIISGNDYDSFTTTEPNALEYIREFIGSEELINGTKRFCLWFIGIAPGKLRQMPEVMKRIEACQQYRLKSPKRATRKCAEFPSHFMEIRQPSNNFLAIPEVSSERRQYVPIGYLSASTIVSNKIFTISGATLYHFGVLTSSTHMAWTRAVCGRLGSGYSYSKGIVYNNFPWPDATDDQKATVETLAQGVLDARALYPGSSLADLYDPLTMPPELLKAHQALDRAVMKLYGFPTKDTTESDIVAALMKRYQELTEGK